MLHQIISYITFLLRSSNQHGVHSPFVYNLITKCFYDKTNYNSYKQIALYGKTLRKSKLKIDVTDLGSGSRVFKSNQRSVSKMAQKVGASKKETKLLFRLLDYFKINTVLELGTSLGIATHAMHLGNPKAKITTIEGCPNISTFTKGTFKQFNVKNIEILTGDFSEVIRPLTSKTYDLIYFDGNHQKQATLDYFESLLPTATNASVFIFDDIYWSKGMTEAWETIKKHPQVTVTIDTFMWGIVFFRKEQKKEHFTIRI
ncbi:O-methyltransferase [Lacinutrix jangbogonensis]|uniref:O-methyltransferase n=1 Tax=Lacinutrix jangbogonensis TaxID=1469557 RepID=UPI00053D0D53|nr:class I SAM-dependent methyltransferase [Lacinutrix jangbogonensis]